MANQYTLTNDFAEIEEEKGTLYNKGDSAIELASTADTAKGAGIVLLTGERRTFSGTLYARSMDEEGLLNVADFKDGGEGGDGTPYRYMGSVATYADLPDNAAVGDVYDIQEADDDHGILAGDNVAWNGTSWDRLAGIYAIMQGATSSAAGKAGLVPKPTAGQTEHVLTGAATWMLPYGFRKPSTDYALGDIAYLSALSVGKKLVCVKAGTTAAGALTLSSTDEGTIITDGTVVWEIDSLADGIYTAGHANGANRGADLTAYWESGLMSANMRAGKFVGMHPEDYIVKPITVDGTTYNEDTVLGDFDYHLDRGSTATTAHHVLAFTRGGLGKARMNETNTTEGGYIGSEMWTVTIPKYAAGIQAAFGSSHVLSHRELLTNSVSASSPSAAGAGYVGTANNWEWADVIANLFNEPMVYGNHPFSSSAFDIGDCNTQVAAMRHDKSLSFTRTAWCWLRAVASASLFAIVYGNGIADRASASGASGSVRLYFLLY